MSLANERIWGENDATNTDFNLDAAYVTMKEMLYAPLTVTVGRQPLYYGNGLIIADGDGYGDAAVASVSDLAGGVNFDAIKAVLSYDALTIDMIASRVTNNTVGESVTATRDNVNLYGVNANYKVGDSKDSVVEAYTFVKIDNGTDTRGAGAAKTETVYVPGLRLSSNPIEGVHAQIEGAYQFGQYNDADAQASQSLKGAYALQAKVDYALPMMDDMKPSLGLAYTYLSGDPDTTDNSKNRRGWDAMFGDQNAGRIFYSESLGVTNAQVAQASLELTPVQDVVTKFSVNGLWLAEKKSYVDGTTNSSKYMGTEADLDVTYAYTEDVKLGMSAGYFVRGKNYVTPGNKDASQLL
ncbi:MAG: hypothetical protein EOM68_31520, partial [Spirochaetia bacterium]|nr:hypothetical protein [Spirochaetia bacterium]